MLSAWCTEPQILSSNQAVIYLHITYEYKASRPEVYGHCPCWRQKYKVIRPSLRPFFAPFGRPATKSFINRITDLLVGAGNGHLEWHTEYKMIQACWEVLSPTRLKKTIERSPFFVRRGGHCCRGDLVGRTAFWIVFEWLAKSQSLVAVACFLPGRAKDLSAPIFLIVFYWLSSEIYWM